MDIDTANMIFSGIRLVGGFFDFLVFVALLVVALMYVRKVDGTLGYILTGAATLNFLTTCCGNVVSSLSEQIGEAAMMVGAAVSGLGLFIELALWGSILYVLFALASKAPQQG